MIIGCSDGFMVSFLRLQHRIYRAWRQGNFTVWSWKPIILDVIVSFFRTILKRRKFFSRLNVLNVEYLLNRSVFRFIDFE